MLLLYTFTINFFKGGFEWWDSIPKRDPTHPIPYHLPIIKLHQFVLPAMDPVSPVNQELGKDANASKLRSECAPLAAESYKCLEKGNYDACKPFFDEYKACRKNEHTNIVESRRKRFK